jgi:hypothetical protein
LSEDGDERGDEQGTDDGGVEQDPGAEGGGHDLEVGFGAGGQGGEGEEHDERGPGDQPSGAADALGDRGAGGAGAVAFLADAGEDEDLVVHGQAVQEGEGDQGYPVGDRPGRGQAPDGPRAVEG